MSKPENMTVSELVVFWTQGGHLVKRGEAVEMNTPPAPEVPEVVDVEAVLDEQGNEVPPAVIHIEKKLIATAGDRYS